jgi:hypothetical protein
LEERSPTNRRRQEAAIDRLRKKGISKAAKAGRAAAEGLVAVDANTGRSWKCGNAETDLRPNEEFDCKGRLCWLKEGGDRKAAGRPMGSVQRSRPDRDGRQDHEYMSVRRAAALSVNPGVVAAYGTIRLRLNWARSALVGLNPPPTRTSFPPWPSSLPCMSPPPRRWR